MAVISTEYKTPWFAVKSSTPDDGKGEPFYFTIRKPKVVILPYFRGVEDQFHLFLLQEPISIWGSEEGTEFVALTGTIDKNEPPDVCGMRELSEEMGIICPIDEEGKWIYVGNFCFDKGTSSQNHLYLVDVTNCRLGERKTDGSWFERNTKVAMLKEDDYRIRYSKDIYLHFLLNHLRLTRLTESLDQATTTPTNRDNIYGEESQAHDNTVTQGAIVIHTTKL